MKNMNFFWWMTLNYYYIRYYTSLFSALIFPHYLNTFPGYFISVQLDGIESRWSIKGTPTGSQRCKNGKIYNVHTASDLEGFNGYRREAFRWSLNETLIFSISIVLILFAFNSKLNNFCIRSFPVFIWR